MKKKGRQPSKTQLVKCSTQELISEAEKKLIDWSSQISKDLKSWLGRSKSSKCSDFADVVDIPLIYYYRFLADSCADDNLEYDHQAQENQQIEDLRTIFLSAPLFETNQSKGWTVEISKMTYLQLQNHSYESITKVTLHLMIYQKGFIPINGVSSLNLSEIKKSKWGEMRYYEFDQLTPFITIGIKKVPQFSTDNSKTICQKFYHFIELEVCRGQKDINQTIEYLQKVRQFDYKCSFSPEQLIKIEIKQSNGIKPIFGETKLKYQDENDDSIIQFSHNEYECINEGQIDRKNNQFLKAMKTFYEKIKICSKKQKKRDYQLKVNFQEVKKFILFISDKAHSKFKLTHQQLGVLEKVGTLIVIGRSGTGKTLLSILRLFALEYLTKQHYVTQKMAQISNQHEVICQQYIRRSIFIEKNIFLTASPFLIEQIIKQYQDLDQNQKNEHKQKCKLCDGQFEIQNDPLASKNMDRIDQLLLNIELKSNIDYPISRLPKESFPAFFTTRSFMLMIDCGIERPYFNYSKSSKTQKNNLKFKVNIYDANNRNVKRQVAQMIEVNYKYFSKSIWPEISSAKILKQRQNLNSSVVWTEIYSTIKGSIKAHLSPSKCIGIKDYVNQYKNSLLDKQTKIIIYELFERYENWKIVNRAFDIMDFVNHILQEILINGYDNQYVDYLFIDEVQDLTQAAIYLLSKIARKDIFYCGDTAQSISKGVSFKFSEIKEMFNKKCLQFPIDKVISNRLEQLSANFRSHNQILKLANSIISALELLFPKSIDVMNKEQSDLCGPKALIVDNGSIQYLFQLLLEDSSSTIVNKKFESQQIIIVRNQEEKQRLPQLLKKQFILTTEQIKGLEFNDVVIYNFFASSQCLDQWCLLEYLEIDEKWVNKQEFLKRLIRRNVQEYGFDDQISIQKMMSLGYDFDRKEFLMFDVTRNNKYLEIDIKKYHQLASELKIFYTLVTRARNTVIIFDEKIPRWVSKYLKRLELVNTVTQSNLQQFKEEIIQYRLKQNHQKYLNPQKLWQDQALKMFARENYEQAIKCFENAGNQNAVIRVKATKLNKQAQMQLHRILTQLENPEKLPKEQFKLKQMKLNKQKKDLFIKYQKIGDFYCKINRFQDAADAYFKGQFYQQALEFYQKINEENRMAQCLVHLKRYQEAILIFEKTKNYQQILDCYILMGQIKQIFDFLRTHKQLIKAKVKELKKLKKSVFFCLTKLLEEMFMKDDIQIEQNFQINFTQKPKKDIKALQRICNEIHQNESSRIKNIVNFYQAYQLKTAVCKLLKMKQDKTSVREKIASLKKQLKQKQTIDEVLNSDLTQQKGKLKLLQVLMQKHEQNSDEKLNPEIQNQKRTISSLQKQLKQNQQKMCEIQNQLLIKKSSSPKKRRRNKMNESQSESSSEWEDVQVVNKEQLRIFDVYAQQIREAGQTFMMKFDEDDKLSEYDNQSKLSQDCSYYEIEEDSNSSCFLSQQYDQRFKSQVFSIWLKESTILNMFEELSQIIVLADSLFERPQIQRISLFDHRKLLQNIAIEESKKDESIKIAIQLLESVEQFNVELVSLTICDYYSLNYHAVPILLSYSLKKSLNFKEKRRIKEVTNIVVREQESNQIRQQIAKFCQNVGEMLLTKKYLRHATREATYYEPVVKTIIEGLILQGFYKNSFAFCSKEQIQKLAYLFMNYEVLLSQGINVSKESTKKYKYYFYPSNSEPTKKLISIYTMQKIFYDMDKCQKNPMLSKGIQVDQIELDDDQILECSKLVEKSMQSIDKQSIVFRGVIKDKQQEIEMAKRDIVSQIKRIKNTAKKLKDNIFKNQEILFQEQKQLRRVKDQLKVQELQSNVSKRQLGQMTKQKKKVEGKIKSLRAMNINKQALLIEQKYLKKVLEKQKEYDNRYESCLKYIRQNKKQIQSFERSIHSIKQRLAEYRDRFKNTNTEIKLIETEKDVKIQKIKEQINDIELRSKKWEKLKDYDEKQKEISRKIIFQAKQNKIEKLNNAEKEKKIKEIEKSSNLRQMKDYLYLFLLIQEKFDLMEAIKNDNTLEIFRKIFLQSRKIESKMTEIQICNIIITYLSFLFNPKFKKVCSEYCIRGRKFYWQNNQKIRRYQQQIRQTKSNLFYFRKKLEQTSQRHFEGDAEYFNENIRQNLMKLEDLEKQFRAEGLDMHSGDPYQDLHNLLSITYKLKNISRQTYRFAQILYGFFQCRIIKDCELLGFLQDEYVLVQSDSIVLKKMREYNYLSFAYYFDCENKVILAKFKEVQKTIIHYLEIQHNLVYDEFPELTVYREQLKSVKQVNINKTGYIEKNMIGLEKKTGKPAFIQTLRRTLNFDRSEFEKLNEQFKDNKLLMKVKNLKQTVLQFYLGSELQEKQSFEFVLYQLKEYHHVEMMINQMELFDLKLMKELNYKVEEMEKCKQKWIKEERHKYSPCSQQNIK